MSSEEGPQTEKTLGEKELAVRRSVKQKWKRDEKQGWKEWPGQDFILWGATRKCK